MRSLLWSKRALDDLDRIAMFNETYSEARAAHVNWRIVSQAMTLPAMPYRGRPASRDARVLSLPDVQYVLSYSVTDAEVTILGVHSTREQRKP